MCATPSRGSAAYGDAAGDGSAPAFPSDRGTLLELLANPVSPRRIAAVREVALVALRSPGSPWRPPPSCSPSTPSPARQGLDPANLVAATIATGALLLLRALAVGAATENRSMALGIGSTVAVVGLAVESLAAQVPVLRSVRDIMPWHWLLDGDPLRRGWALDIWEPPLLVSVAVMAAGIALFARRDVR